MAKTEDKGQRDKKDDKKANKGHKTLR